LVKVGLHVTREAERAFRRHLASRRSAVIETLHLALPTHTLHAVQVQSKPVGNEGHFTREAETVFHPYLASHFNGLTEISHLALPTHALFMHLTESLTSL
jgi:hypothetical protein